MADTAEVLYVERQKVNAFGLDIRLLDSPVEVWRRIVVPAGIRLPKLHEALQIAMGWRDAHLWEILWGDMIISSSPGGDMYQLEKPANIRDAAKLRLSDLSLRQDSLLTYLYDFGDDWVHAIRVIRQLGDEIDRPKVLDGGGACPPEDVGGVGGYEEFLAAWSDPDDPEHEDVRTWGTGWWTPGPFDPAEADRRMAARFRRRPRRKPGPDGA